MIIITQKDYFYIPQNIDKIVQEFGSDNIKLIIQIESNGSINSKKNLFIRGFGLSQSLKYGFKVLEKKVRLLLSYCFNFKKSHLDSIKNVSRHYKISFIKVSNINDPKLLEKLKILNPEIIISYSAPSVFKKQLLELPKYGCINLHCSLLPLYAGLFPSFWVLFNKENTTGCTVHLMDDKIDNGGILGQIKVNISSTDTIFSLLQKNEIKRWRFNGKDC